MCILLVCIFDKDLERPQQFILVLSKHKFNIDSHENTLCLYALPKFEGPYFDTISVNYIKLVTMSHSIKYSNAISDVRFYGGSKIQCTEHKDYYSGL